MTHVTLAGAALDSGNLGVGALATSILEAVDAHGDGAHVVVFDNGIGRRKNVVVAGEKSVEYRALGMRNSRRWHKPESLFQMRLAARTGLPNPAVEAMKTAAACLDISGGDSFTDMYGPERFQLITQPKELVLNLGLPLVLMPQTYGPYYSCLLYTSPSPRDRQKSRMPSSA